MDVTDKLKQVIKDHEAEVKAFREGQQSCAAYPWTYRTTTGDETGEVVESAELPKGGE